MTAGGKTVESTLDLADVCGPMPGGAELARGYGGNLRLTIEGVLSLTEPMRWGIRIEKPRPTASGRQGKPTHVLLLVAEDGEGPADLLRQLAEVWDQGAIEVAR